MINIEKTKPCPSGTLISDPFMLTWRVSERLSNEFMKHRNLVIAFDFDNTIYDFHNKGYEFPEVINLLYRASKLNLTLVCYTGNEDEALVRSVCAKYNIRIDYLNESPIKSVSRPHKPYFSILLDDRAGLASAVEALSIVLYKIEGGVI